MPLHVICSVTYSGRGEDWGGGSLAWPEADGCLRCSRWCTEGHAWWPEVVVLSEVEREADGGIENKLGEDMIFLQLCTLISPPLGHEIHPYL